MSHKLNQIIEIVADKCKYLLKIYIYDKKNGRFPSVAAMIGDFSGCEGQRVDRPIIIAMIHGSPHLSPA